MHKHKQKILGFPLSIGLKKKVALKHIHRWWTNERIEHAKPLENKGIGDLINECSGLNSRLIELEPSYVHIGKGMVLRDIDWRTDSNAGSFKACGVGPPISQEEAEKYREELLKAYADQEEDWGFTERYSKENMTIHADGTYTQKKV